MITVPMTAAVERARIYRDSRSADIAYVDLLEPAPILGAQPARWFPMPGEVAYLAGEIRFGPGQEGFGKLPGSLPAQRLMPMPWEISPIYVWYRDGDSSRVIASGKTSGYGASNTVFNGTAPMSAMISPVRIGAELSCPARITASVHGTGDPGAVLAAVNAPAPDTAWDATAGEFLLARLEELLQRGELTLSVEGGDLRELALLEWAHRLQSEPKSNWTLGFPVTAMGNMRWTLTRGMEIDWRPGDAVSLRAIRVLRCPKLE